MVGVCEGPGGGISGRFVGCEGLDGCEWMGGVHVKGVGREREGGGLDVWGGGVGKDVEPVTWYNR